MEVVRSLYRDALGISRLGEMSAVWRNMLDSEGFSWKGCAWFECVGLKKARPRFGAAWHAKISEWGKDTECTGGDKTLRYKDQGGQHSQDYLHWWRAVKVIEAVEMPLCILLKLARLQWRISKVVVWLEPCKTSLISERILVHLYGWSGGEKHTKEAC